MSQIYVLTNIQNGKQYIGKTERAFNTRLSEHLFEAGRGVRNYPVYNAISKYGIENFHIECLEVNGDINLWEKHLIKRWNTKAPHGYNLTDGGEGSAGLVHSDEANKRKAKIQTGRTVSIATRKRMSEAQKGIRPSEEAKRKMSESSIGQIPWNKGKKMLSITGARNYLARAIFLLCPNGEEEYFGSIMDACRKYNLHSGHISMVAQGKLKQHKGYRCRYA